MRAFISRFRCVIFAASVQWLCFASQGISADLELVVSVEKQPLASNIRRVMKTLDQLGYPLDAGLQSQLRDAMAGDDAVALQQILDKQVLGAITVNPEERVSVTRIDPRVLVTHRGGYAPVLLKILNFSGSTARLQVKSVQAGAVFNGAAKLSMERQQQTVFLNKQQQQFTDSFLEIELHQAPPMTRNLSGLEAEYVILLIASSQSGKREAVLKFDLGDGTADLENRSELPILLDVRPSVPVKFKVFESDGTPSIARLEIRDQLGRVFPLQAKRLAPDFFFQSHIYRSHGETIDLAPGRYQVTSSRGPEYLLQKHDLLVKAGEEPVLEVHLKRWYSADSHGFYSGDHHIHAAGCAHYTDPTEGVSPKDMYRQVWGEGLNVGCVLTWGPCYEFQRQYFEPEAIGFGHPLTKLKYDLEVSGFGSQALGHVCLLNLSNQTYPGSEGTKNRGWPTWTTPVMKWAKDQGGVTGYAHSASGLSIDPESATSWLIKRYDQDGDGGLNQPESSNALLPHRFVQVDRDRDGVISKFELIQSHEIAKQELPNYAIPEMNGVGAMEICVSTVAGVCDFISSMDTGRIQEWNTWYHLLNSGFPLKVSGETDFPCMSSRRVGKGRVYVHLGEVDALDFTEWCQGLARGTSYVSDGYAHLPRFEVNGVSPGDGEVELESEASLKIEASVAFAPSTPVSFAQGTDPRPIGREIIGDTVNLHGSRSEEMEEGGKRVVELVVNGEVVESREVLADGKIHTLNFSLHVDKSSWVCIRQFPQLHSNPVTVIVGGKPIRCSSRSARWCAEMTKRLWENRKNAIVDSERSDAKIAFDHAIAVLESIAEESTQ